MILKIKDIEKYYDKNLIINKSTFEIKEGEVVALIGRNGTGKTTALNIIANIIDPNIGEILIDKVNVKFKRQLLSNIIYIPDNFNMLTMSTVKNIAYYYKEVYPNFDMEYFNEKMKLFGFSLKKIMKKFSKGQRALISTLLGLASQAKFMLLDEPLDGIDIILRKKIVDLMIEEVEKKRSILITSHQLLELESISDRILIFNKDKEIVDKTSSQDTVYKFQIAYDVEFPKELEAEENLRFISQFGRVYTIVVKGDKAEWIEKLEKTKPILMDELNINIKDTFIMESTMKGDEI